MSLRDDLELLAEHLKHGGFTQNDISTVNRAIGFVDAIVAYYERQKQTKVEDESGSTEIS